MSQPQKNITTNTHDLRPRSRQPIRNTRILNLNRGSEIPSVDHSEEEKKRITENEKEPVSNHDDSNSASLSERDDVTEDEGSELDEPVDGEVDGDCEPSNSGGTPRVSFIVCSIMIVLIATVVYASFSDPVAPKPVEVQSITRIKADFKSQSDELWASFEAGVNDVVTFNKPSIFIFLYKEEAESTLNRLLNKLAQLAACNITSCSQTPLELTSRTLNSPEILKDYGVILERYQTDLEEKGVLIVKQLEKVSGASAQAFHSICDEITPFVSKLLIMFTIKVKEQPLSHKESFQHVVEFLRGPWKDEMKPEVFNALIARITNMIIQVNP